MEESAETPEDTGLKDQTAPLLKAPGAFRHLSGDNGSPEACLRVRRFAQKWRRRKRSHISPITLFRAGICSPLSFPPDPELLRSNLATVFKLASPAHATYLKQRFVG